MLLYKALHNLLCLIISFYIIVVLGISKRSTTKPDGEIYIKSCNPGYNYDIDSYLSQPYNLSGNALYPLHIPAKYWLSCQDAYEHTWLVDKHSDIIGLTYRNKLQLVKSMGFCPHHRCQLTNLDSASNNNQCPKNLCYTKLENGGRSYGACCFLNNSFHSGDLLGYYNKTQTTPKPIYKHSRVILGYPLHKNIYHQYIKQLLYDNLRNMNQQSIESIIEYHRNEKDNDDNETNDNRDSYDRFINANIIYPGIIATQCPLDHTIMDIKRMIVEQNISLWIQLAPSFKYKSNVCKIFPEEYVTTLDTTILDSSIYDKNSIDSSVNIFQFMNLQSSIPIEPNGYHCNHNNNTDDDTSDKECSIQISMIDIYYQSHYPYNIFIPIPTTTLITTYDQQNDSMQANTEKPAPGIFPGSDKDHILRKYKHEIKIIKYLQWDDFKLPLDEDLQNIRVLVNQAVQVLLDGGTIAISCLSGRGRTGTLASMIIGTLKKTKTHSELVNIIVNIREHRDGLVETPRHYWYISKVLQLNPTNQCTWYACSIYKTIDNLLYHLDLPPLINELDYIRINIFQLITMMLILLLSLLIIIYCVK